LQLKRQVIDLAALLRSSLDDHRAVFQERGIALESRCEPGPLWVDADPTRIVQVMINLLSNAKKFTPRGGRVEVAVERAGTRVRVTVRDTGPGIAPEFLPRVFEPFTQAPQSLDRSAGGVGLGLATVKGLIELHGGAVSVDSGGIGHGTEVSLSLPLVEAPSVSHRARPRAARRAPRQIVLIEDNQDIAEGLQALLSNRGHSVRIAPDGQSGIELVKALMPDLVLCDIGLPGIDGYEVARILRADPATQGVYLVALSGYARPEDVMLSTRAGFNRHLAKPASPGLLDRAIEETPTSRVVENPPGQSLH
jgi:CheY-like chemotaxis protein